MIYYIIYETTNLVNRMKYRGAHCTSVIEDGYIGSGTRLKRAISKYKKDKFSCTILCCALTEEYLYQLERDVFVTDDWVTDNTTYNINVGGNGARPSNTKVTPVFKKDMYTGKIITRFTSARDAATWVHAIRSIPYIRAENLILKCCNNKTNRSAYGFIWSRDDTETSPISQIITSWDSSGKVISTYTSITEAANSVEGTPCRLSKVLNNQTRSSAYKGRLWGWGDVFAPTIDPQYNSKSNWTLCVETGQVFPSSSKAGLFFSKQKNAILESIKYGWGVTTPQGKLHFKLIDKAYLQNPGFHLVC